MKKIKKILITGIFLLSSISINAISFFSGYAGGKLNFAADTTDTTSTDEMIGRLENATEEKMISIGA